MQGRTDSAAGCIFAPAKILLPRERSKERPVEVDSVDETWLAVTTVSPHCWTAKAPEPAWPHHPLCAPAFDRTVPVMFGQVPNINGAFYSVGSTDGAFFLNDTQSGTIANGEGYYANWTGLDAARSSNIYKKDAAVQPKALNALPCIRC